jgi:hypothetical protein
VSSIEAGGGLPGFAATYTWTPQQIADFLAKYVLPGPAMGPEDELSPFAVRLQSKTGTIGQPPQANVARAPALTTSPAVFGDDGPGQIGDGNGIDDWWEGAAPAPPYSATSPVRRLSSPILDIVPADPSRSSLGPMSRSVDGGSESFDSRFGNWSSAPAGSIGASQIPRLARAAEKVSGFRCSGTNCRAANAASWRRSSGERG